MSLYNKATDHMIFIAPYPLTKLSIMNILAAMHVEPQIVESFDGITEIEKGTGLILADLFSFDQDYRHLFSLLRSSAPQAVLLALLDDDSDSLRCSVMLAGADMVINVNRADIELPEAIRRADFLSQFPTDGEEPGYEMEVRSMEQKDEGFLKRSFTRRKFLKGSAAAVGAAAVLGSGGNMLRTLADNAGGDAAGGSGDQVFYGSCRGNCFGGCRVKITVRDGKVVKTEMAEFPDARYNRICAKGMTHMQWMYSPDRLLYPLKRVGERGAGQWEQIEWDDAISTITDSWKQYQKESGPTSIAFSMGNGNYGNLTFQTAARLYNLMGAVTMKPGDCYDMNYNVAAQRCLGVDLTYFSNELASLPNAKTILIWGANPTCAQPHNCHFMFDAKDNGAKLIQIDPVYNGISSKCDMRIPLRPGTDAALAMAMINIIIENGWQDESFLKASTVAPFLVKESGGKFLRLSDLGKAEADSPEDGIVVRSESGTIGLSADIDDPVISGSFTIEGYKVTTAFDLLLERTSEWTVERAAELCDISQEMITEVAETYANNTPGSIMIGYGLDHYYNGFHAYTAINALAMITGNLGKPGATMGAFFQLGIQMDTRSIGNPLGLKSSKSIPFDRVSYILNNKEYADEPFELRSLFSIAHNPIGNAGGQTEFLNALDNLDLLVVSDWRMTDTAKYADILLPVAHWFEVNDVHGSISQTPFTSLQEKAAEPPAECKSDWEIFQLLGRKMGFEEQFELTEEELIKIACTGTMADALGFSYDELMEKKVIRSYPPNQEDGTYVFGNGGVFPTATGRATFYFEDPKPDYVVGANQKIDPELEHLPYWEPPNEAWPETIGGFEKNPLAEKYPLIYTSERSRLKTHSMFSHNKWLLELMPEPLAKVNPADAEERNIADGDYARLYNDRGSVTLKIVYNDGVRPGMIVVPKGWQHDQFKDGHYTSLTINKSHSLVQNFNYFDNLCQMEKA